MSRKFFSASSVQSSESKRMYPIVEREFVIYAANVNSVDLGSLSLQSTKMCVISAENENDLLL